MSTEKDSAIKSKSKVKEFPKDEVKSSSAIGKFFLVIFILIIAVGFGWYFMKYQEAQQRIDDLLSAGVGQKLSEEEITNLIDKVGKLVLLPEGEIPTVVVIEDAIALAEQQPFFKGASDGDKILIYSEKAFIYNPEKNILVNVGPVYFEDKATTTAEEGTEPVVETPPVPEVQKINLEIRNGSNTVGIAQELANNLSVRDIYNIVGIKNAVNSEYAGIILVNLSGEDVSDLESMLGVTAVDVLPEGETDAQAGVVVIIGNNE